MGRLDCAGWEVEGTAVISAVCRTAMCWTYKHRHTAALQAREYMSPQTNFNHICSPGAQNLSKISTVQWLKTGLIITVHSHVASDWSEDP